MKGSVVAAVGLLLFFTPFFARSQGADAGNAVVFSGNGDYIYTGASDVPAPWTASMWVNRQNSLDSSAALFFGSSGALKLEQFGGGRMVGFSKFGVADYLFSYLAPVGVWTHLTFVATTTNIALYVNGQFKASNANSIPLPLNQFGGPTGDRLNAAVDEVAVWNYARSATDISNSYAFHLFAPASGLALLWHFDEATNATPVALDSSGNGHDGYFSNNLSRAISTAPILTNSAIVTSLNDSGAGTLRNALGVAGALGGAVVTFSPALSGGTIYLTNFPLSISGNITVDASQLGEGITLDGNSQTNIFNVSASAGATLRNLTLTHGVARFGGAISNAGTLNLDYDVFSNNLAVGRSGAIGEAARGGAVYNLGPASVNHCTFIGNTARAGDSSQAGQRGGAAFGGAIDNASFLTVSNSTFTQNSVVAGINTSSGSSDGAFGGAICNTEVGAQTLTISQCTIVNNSALPGFSFAGIFSVGGGIDSAAILNLNQSTVVSNSAAAGGGLHVNLVNLFNSIISGNSSDNEFGYPVVQTGNNLLTGDPLLTPLSNFGGPTMTMLPLANSPAFDGGSDSALSSFPTDQRGQPRLSGLHVDIGAAETVLPIISDVTATLVSTNMITGQRLVLVSATFTHRNLPATGGFRFAPADGPAFTNSFVVPMDLPQSVVSNTVAFNPGNAVVWSVAFSNVLGTFSTPDQILLVRSSGIAGDLNGDGIVSQGELDQVYSNYLANSPFLLMTNVAGLGGTNVTFSLSNSLAGAYTVQYSTDLVTWSNLGPATPLYQFIDTNAPALPLRYYRLRYP